MAATQKKKQQEAPAPQVEARIDRILSAGGCGSIVSKVSQSALLRKKNAHIGMQFGSLFRPQKKKYLNFLWKQGVQNPVFAAIGEGIIFLPAMNLDKHRPGGHIR